MTNCKKDFYLELMEHFKNQINEIEIFSQQQKQIEEIEIEKENKIEEENEWVKMHLRLPKKLMLELEYLRSQEFGISRTGWILQAIHEKIKRTNNESITK